MPRKVLPCPPDKPKPVSQGGPEVWSLPIKLITPLFGGGVRTRENDPSLPIRLTAIRGQLRYWWRIVAGSLLANPLGADATGLLWQRESEVFGTTEFPSPFDLLLEAVTAPTYRVLGNGNPYGFGRFDSEMYALFPATQDRQAQASQIIREGLTFQLRVRWLAPKGFNFRCGLIKQARHKTKFPDPWDLVAVQNQLRMALWGWLNFGGIGCRTRRGLGSVSTSDPEYSLQNGANLRYSVPNVSIYTSPAVAGNNVEMGCWSKAVEVYRSFRQSASRTHHPGRIKQSLRYSQGQYEVRRLTVEAGRTHWPEPDAIRAVTGCSLLGGNIALPGGLMFIQNDHRVPMNDNYTPAFPRAILGLPINFHFADGPLNVPAGAPPALSRESRDPCDTQLVPQVVDKHGKLVSGQRMASPVITRALRINNQWRPAVVIIRTAALEKLSAQLMSGNVAVAGGNVAAPQIQGPALRQLPVMRGKDDALSAFEVYLTGKQFTRL